MKKHLATNSVVIAVVLCLLLPFVTAYTQRETRLAESLAISNSSQYYKIDPHAHSVLSGDSVQDLGVMAETTKALGFDAIFVTDHTATSNNPIGGVVANHVVFDDSAMQWTPTVSGLPSSHAAEEVATPRRSGTASYHVRVATAAPAESFAWIKRGPNLRSGPITLRFSAYPTDVSANSGIFLSASIGGDETIENRPPVGYTTAAGVVSPGKSTVFVWQLGGARTPSSDPNRRVITYDLPYTLNQWNNYTIDVTAALNDIPAADRPIDFNALTAIKMSAAASSGTAEGFFDDVHIDATGIPAGQEFADRNQYIGTFDTPTYQQFASQEIGYNDHAQMFKFDTTNPADFVVNKKGSLAIPYIQATGYPAQLNHPALPGGVTEQEATGSVAYGAELMETVPRGADTTMIRVWDEIMQQSGQPLIGTWTSDSHRVDKFGPATYVFAHARGFDAYMRALFEGRAYMANTDFPGRVEFRIDGAAGPYPSRYPIFVGTGSEFATPMLEITDGLSTGDQVVWIRNGTPIASDLVAGSSFSMSRPIHLAPGTTYIRAEVHDATGAIKAMTEPIFVKKMGSLPDGLALHAQSVSTPSGTGYINANVKGVNSAAWDPNAETALLSMQNPIGSLVEVRGRTGAWDVDNVRAAGTLIPRATSLNDYEQQAGPTWFYDVATRTVLVKAIQVSATTPVAIEVTAGSDTLPPSTPTDFEALAEHARLVSLHWGPASDDVGVTHYRVRRDGVLLAQTPASQLSLQDTTMSPGISHTYSVEAVDGVGQASQRAEIVVYVPAIVTTELVAIQDSYVSESTPNTGFGSATSLRIDGSPILNTYLRFTVPPASGVVLSSGLKLFTNSAAGAGLEVRTTSGSWSESALRYTNAPAFSAVAAVSGPVTAGAWKTTDLTGMGPLSGQINLAVTTAGSTAVNISSRESANAPRLVVTTSETAPTASAVIVSGPEGTEIPWTPNVADADGSTLTCAISEAPAFGSTTVASNCSTGAFTPPPQFVGTATFTYAVTDGTSIRHALVTVNVTPENDAPVIDDDTGNPEAVEDNPVGLTFDAQDPDGDCPLTFEVSAAPKHGTLGPFQLGPCVAGSQSADVTYFPAANYAGSDSFKIVVRDPAGATSTQVENNLFVTPVNDAPEAGAVAMQTTQNATAQWTPSVHDLDSPSLTCSISILPSHGIAVVQPDCSAGTYTPGPSAPNSDSFTYQVSDGDKTATAQVSVTINGTNAAPVMAPASVSTPQLTPVTITVVATDIEGACPLTFATTQLPAHGTLSPPSTPTCSAGTASTTYRYTPTGAYSGSDAFSVTATDPSAATSPPQAVSITVTPALFADDFEFGNVSKWSTNSRVSIQPAPVHGGAWALEAGGTSSYVRRALATDISSVTFSTWVYATDVTDQTIGLLGARNVANNAILGLQIAPGTRRLRVRNEVTGATVTSATVLPVNVWTKVELTLTVAGSSSSWQVRVNDVALTDLAQPSANLGTSLIRYVQLGHNSTGTYHWYLDDFVAKTP